MPDSRPREEDVPNQYEQMSTESLRQLLREDASKPEGEEGNTEDLFRVMAELARRRQALGEGRSPEEALASFRKYYDMEEEAARPTVRARKRFRGLAAAAAVAAILIAGTVTASAFKIDFWEPVARWAQETFHFGHAGQETRLSDPQSDPNEVGSGLQEKLDQYGIDTALAPTWLPEDYSKETVEIKETPYQRQFYADYKNDENAKIEVWITDYLDSYPVQIEQSSATVEVYESGGIQYYIFENMNRLYAAWINGHFECQITGPVSLAEMERIIDSIEKG